jgi:hypothetical protein
MELGGLLLGDFGWRRGALPPWVSAVQLVLRKLGAGMTAEQIILDHPRLTPEDVRAAQAFAADYLADEVLVRIPIEQRHVVGPA